LMLQIPTRSLLQSISNLHQMDCRMSYFALSMHRVGICGLLIMTLGGWWYRQWQFLPSDFWCCNFRHRMYSKASRITSNCLQIVIFRILYAQSWHIWMRKRLSGVDDAGNGNSLHLNCGVVIPKLNFL
jgi:hypothetical protein